MSQKHFFLLSSFDEFWRSGYEWRISIFHTVEFALRSFTLCFNIVWCLIYFGEGKSMMLFLTIQFIIHYTPLEALSLVDDHEWMTEGKWNKKFYEKFIDWLTHCFKCLLLMLSNDFFEWKFDFEIRIFVNK